VLFQQEGTGSWDMGLDGVFHLGSVDCVLHYFLPSLHERRVEVPFTQEVNFPTVASLYCSTIISLRLLASIHSSDRLRGSHESNVPTKSTNSYQLTVLPFFFSIVKVRFDVQSVVVLQHSARLVDGGPKCVAGVAVEPALCRHSTPTHIHITQPHTWPCLAAPLISSHPSGPHWDVCEARLLHRGCGMQVRCPGCGALWYGEATRCSACATCEFKAG
jgi:hypothetical protein